MFPASRQPERKQGVDLDAQHADRFLHAFERNRVRDAKAFGVARARLALLQLRFDLRARAVHQYYANPRAVQQVDVVRELDEPVLREYFSPEREHEGLAAERVKVWCNGAKPAHELGIGRGRHRPDFPKELILAIAPQSLHCRDSGKRSGLRAKDARPEAHGNIARALRAHALAFREPAFGPDEERHLLRSRELLEGLAALGGKEQP